MQERYCTRTRTSWLASPSVRAQAQQVSGGVFLAASCRATRRRQAGSACVLKQPRPLRQPRCKVATNVAWRPCPGAFALDARQGFAPMRLDQCPLGSESDGGAALPQSVGMGHYRKSGAGPSNAPRSIFLLSGQSYRLILSCRNEIAESLLARSGGVHAVGGQTLDL